MLNLGPNLHVLQKYNVIKQEPSSNDYTRYNGTTPSLSQPIAYMEFSERLRPINVAQPVRFNQQEFYNVNPNQSSQASIKVYQMEAKH